MANVLVDETSLQNIGNIIRKQGGTGNYKPSQMDDAIKTVYDNRVASETKFSSNSNFWKALQDSGNRTDYSKLFMYFTNSNFKPRYDMSPTNATSMFEYSKITDLVTLLNNVGVKLYTAELTSTTPYRMFAFSTITHCPSFLFSNVNLNCTFFGCNKLETIDGLTVFVGTQYTQTFYGCTSLKNIIFEEGSEIGGNISFADSPLSRESIESIINALSDNVTGKTLTLKESAVNNAFVSSEDKVEWNNLINSKLNWIISLV